MVKTAKTPSGFHRCGARLVVARCCTVASCCVAVCYCRCGGGWGRSIAVTFGLLQSKARQKLMQSKARQKLMG